MADKSFSTALLAVCWAISFQFKVTSSNVHQFLIKPLFDKARRTSLRKSENLCSEPEMVAKHSDVAGCRNAASAASVQCQNATLKCAALIGRAECCYFHLDFDHRNVLLEACVW